MPILNSVISGVFRPAISDANWVPNSLFANGEQGVWYDFTDLTTLFQDSAGTTPVTAAGQPVGKMLDKSGRGNHATQVTSTQRPTYQIDSSGKPYLLFDGVDDGMVTGTITPNIDKVQVFSGLRKLSDTAQGIVVEFSAGSGNGRFALAAPGVTLNNFLFNSFGTANSTASSIVAAPTTNVITGLGDISGDTAIIRQNGSQIFANGNDQGTGNYLANVLYVARRGGSTLPFNGRIYSLIVRFGNKLSTDEIVYTENWVNIRTGAY